MCGVCIAYVGCIASVDSITNVQDEACTMHAVTGTIASTDEDKKLLHTSLTLLAVANYPSSSTRAAMRDQKIVFSLEQNFAPPTADNEETIKVHTRCIPRPIVISRQRRQH